MGAIGGIDMALWDIQGKAANLPVFRLLGAENKPMPISEAEAMRIVRAAPELAKARVRYRYETLASIDDASAMAGWFGGTALYYPPPTLSHRLDAMRAVGVADIAKVAHEVLAPDRLALAAVGTLSKARLGELRQVISDWR